MSDAAIVSMVTGVVTIVTLWLKLKYGNKEITEKVDANTAITVKGTNAATANAKSAVLAASDAKTAAESISKKLNGGIDDAIRQAVDPVKELLNEHSRQDAKDLAEVKGKFDALTAYVHERNHDILDAINAQSLKLDRLLQET